MRLVYTVYCLVVLAGLAYLNHHGMNVAHAYRASQARYSRGGYHGGHYYGGYNHK